MTHELPDLPIIYPTPEGIAEAEQRLADAKAGLKALEAEKNFRFDRDAEFAGRLLRAHRKYGMSSETLIEVKHGSSDVPRGLRVIGPASDHGYLVHLNDGVWRVVIRDGAPPTGVLRSLHQDIIRAIGYAEDEVRAAQRNVKRAYQPFRPVRKLFADRVHPLVEMLRKLEEHGRTDGQEYRDLQQRAASAETITPAIGLVLAMMVTAAGAMWDTDETITQAARRIARDEALAGPIGWWKSVPRDTGLVPATYWRAIIMRLTGETYLNPVPTPANIAQQYLSDRISRNAALTPKLGPLRESMTAAEVAQRCVTVSRGQAPRQDASATTWWRETIDAWHLVRASTPELIHWGQITPAPRPVNTGRAVVGNGGA